MGPDYLIWLTQIVMKSMADMFYVGQCVVVKVILVDRSEPLAKVKLSMNPRHIHSNFSAAGLQEDLVRCSRVINYKKQTS